MEEFAGKPNMHALTSARGVHPQSKETPGIFFANGQQATEMRRFLLRNLKDFGFNKSSGDALVEEQVSELCSKLKAEEGQFIDCRLLFNLSTLNGLWMMLTGEKLSSADPKIVTMVKDMKKWMETLESPWALLALFYLPVYKVYEKLGIMDLKKVSLNIPKVPTLDMLIPISGFRPHV